MQALYAQELSGNDAEHTVATVLKPELEGDPATYEFARRLFLRTLGRTGELDALVGTHAKNWDLDRIAPIDRVLLRMATCELLAFEDIPPKVSVDEALEIARRYSTEQSTSFINGILDAVLIDLQQQGRINKSGRGLIGMESIHERTSQ